MKLFREKTEVVLAALLLASLVLVTPRIGESDAVEYFSYLPSILFDHDVDFEDEYRAFYDEDPEGRAGFKETFLDRSSATGLKLNFGPMGSALLWSPFYIATHFTLVVLDALGFSVTADGMSQPYRSAVTFASAFYGAIGLFLSYRLARRFAAPLVSFLAVVALWWATPVAYYMYIAPGMSHAPSLFIVAVFFCMWPWVTESSTPARWAAWGAVAGGMALVRQQDLFFAAAIAVPLWLGKGDVAATAKRLAAFGAAALAVFTPQLIVYQILNGRPLPSSHVANKMAWYSPHSLQVLFSPEHGLFFWSPLLLLFTVGGFLLFKRDRNAAWVLMLGLASQVYISGAVDSWTQAGAFGSRRFVGATVLFAVWGATVFTALEPYLRRAGMVTLVAASIAWNVGIMVQFGLGIMNRDRLVWSEVLRAQFFEVPPRMASVVSGYFSNRDELAGSAAHGVEEGS